MAKCRWTSIPTVMAACWSSAIARNATPVRLRRKNQLTAAIEAPATGEHDRGRAAHQRSETAGDHDQRDQWPADQPAQHHPVEDRRRRHHAGAPEAERPDEPDPSAWSPDATSREASMSDSPRAKLIMREAM